MLRFVIGNKLYDTDKMKLIGNVMKWYKFTSYFEQQFFGSDYGRYYECQLYKSKKGNYLLVHESNGKYIGEAITEEETKALLLKSDYDSYVKEYGEIEEA